MNNPAPTFPPADACLSPGDGRQVARRQGRGAADPVLAVVRMMRHQDARGQNRRVALILGGVFITLWVGSVILMLLRN